MTSTRSADSTAWPLDVPRTCSNGDDRKTQVMLHGVAYCGPCALDAVKRRDIPEVS